MKMFLIIHHLPCNSNECLELTQSAQLDRFDHGSHNAQHYKFWLLHMKCCSILLENGHNVQWAFDTFMGYLPTLFASNPNYS